jgi:GTP-binding protein
VYRVSSDGVYVQCYALGLGDPIPLSAEHGWGLGDVYNVLHDYAVAPVGEPETETSAATELIPDGGEETLTNKIRMAIVGRPNVGKSSLVNCLLGCVFSIS